tara:strand:+ start:198 stop:1247 length:1050 start_codon:yes stop_codon:yes gene_type:complete
MDNDFLRNDLRMPAEWEKQKSTWIAWPHNRKDWPNKFNNIPHVFAKIISSISKVQIVNILIQNKQSKRKIINYLKQKKTNFKNIKMIACKTDRVWVRDSGPIFLKDKKNNILLSNWNFNAWAKYKNFRNDNNINFKISKINKYEILDVIYKKKPVTLEGGSIDVNGEGLLLATRECLLSKIQERNPGLNIKDYAIIFKKILGINKIIWLEKGISGDDTHGHIDDVARFVSKNKVFLAFESNKKDKNYKNLKTNLDILNKTTIKNKKLKIIKIPMPNPKIIEGIRVPATYLNFYIANKIVLVPVFNDAKDKIVLNIFKQNFKSRKIIPINCSELIWGFGAIHCITQQEPN